jgi:hypothetical protein
MAQGCKFAMKRAELLNKILSFYGKPNYLEIGVDAGDTFREVNAGIKHGVDPDFKFDVNDSAYQAQGIELFSITSDQFFKTDTEINYHTAFIDGLHEFGQVLRDLLNTLPRMKKKGVIIIDDVLPCHYQASLPTINQMLAYRAAIGSNDMSWMGDVYKLIYFIREYLPSYSYATSIEAHGQTILWQGERSETDSKAQNLSLSDIEKIGYGETVFDRSAFNIQPLDAIIERIQGNLFDKKTGA